jgi:hypothetical protein
MMQHAGQRVAAPACRQTWRVGEGYSFLVHLPSVKDE